jgi:hypothetical protein
MFTMRKTVSYPNLKAVTASGGFVEMVEVFGLINKCAPKLTHIEINGAGDHDCTLQALIWFIY